MKPARTDSVYAALAKGPRMRESLEWSVSRSRNIKMESANEIIREMLKAGLLVEMLADNGLTKIRAATEADRYSPVPKSTFLLHEHWRGPPDRTATHPHLGE